MAEELAHDRRRGLRDSSPRQSEDALGKLAQDLLENPLVNGAIARAFEAREKAVQAQEVAMGALNLPSAADIERLTRRLRSVSQRLEGIEDGVDRLDERWALAAMAGADERLAAIEGQLAELSARARPLPAALDAAPGAACRASRSASRSTRSRGRRPSRKRKKATASRRQARQLLPSAASAATAASPRRARRRRSSSSPIRSPLGARGR